MDLELSDRSSDSISPTSVIDSCSPTEEQEVDAQPPFSSTEPAVTQSGASATVVESMDETMTHYLVSDDSDVTVLFPSRVLSFDEDRIPAITRPESYNDDLYMSSFTRCRTVWAGEQKKGIPHNIPSAVSHADHVGQALLQPFHLAAPVPLPAELSASLRFIRETPDVSILHFWKEQLRAVRELVQAARPTQLLWDAAAPPSLQPVMGRVASVALTDLMAQYGLGGSRWMRQFTFGFDVMGDLSQKFLFPENPKVAPALGVDSTLVDAAERFALRARASGFAHQDSLWSEALSQVDCGWLTAPALLDDSGLLGSVVSEDSNVTFRFAVLQMDKIRACDDFRYGRVNLACSVRSPITLPTWDHIGQLCLDVLHSDVDWGFFKADHEAAYKNLPLSPEQANRCIVALRSPVDGLWYGFLSRTLLFGASAAVLHYNCFSRIVAVLANHIFGLPLINYFDDFGCFITDFLSEPAVRVFTSFCRMLGIRLKRKKTEVGRRITFLGLEGFFPGRDNSMLLSVDLTESKKRKWAERISEFLDAGVISHQELESLNGRLSFSQTSVFGRFGRALMQPLYKKVNAACYQPVLSAADARVLEWWRGMLSSIRPRVIYPRTSTPQRIIYTDAATSTLIAASITLYPSNCSSVPVVEACRVMTAGPDWVALFINTNLIYGLEMLAIVQTAADPDLDLDGRCVTFYIDNTNAISALIKGDSDTVIISVLSRLFWAICGRRGITPWIEWVPSPVNIADLPTRNTKLPFKCKSTAEFSYQSELFLMVSAALEENASGFLDPDVLIGRFY